MSTRRIPSTACIGLILAGGLLLAITGSAGAQPTPGTVDTSFGGGFVTAVGATSNARAMTVDSVGRVIAVGDYNNHWVITRFTAAGVQDTSFGSAGQVVLFGQGVIDWAMDVAMQTVQNEERIVVVGFTGLPYDNDFTIVRLTSDGSLDPSFGTNGIVQERLTPGGSGSQALVVQPDGKIVVAGFSFNRQNYGAIAIARYTIDGDLDAGNFGPPDKKGNRPGFIIDEVTSRANDAVQQGAIAIQPDGKIVVGCFTGEGSPFPYQPNYGWTVARYNADGTIDTGFGSNGKVTETSLTGFTYIHLTGVGVQSDGKTLTTGRAWNPGPNYGTDMVALRYATTGAQDLTFGVDGLARTGLPELNMRWNRLGIQADDKFVVAATQGYADHDFMAFRFNANGTPDLSFGTSGRSDLIGAYPGSVEWVSSLALDPATGAVFVGGGSIEPRMAVAKFHGDVPSLPDAPTNLGATAVSSSRIDLTWTDNADDEQGFKIERSPDGADWALIDTVGANVTGYSDTGLAPSTTYHYRVRAYNTAGDSAYSNVASDTTQAGGAVDHVAESDIPVAGTVAGTYLDTHAADASSEAITEVETGGKPSKRYSYLEHKWTFSVAGGTTFHVKWSHDPAGDGDTFVFEFSTNGSTFEPFSGQSWQSGYQIHTFPSTVSGTVYIRVRDTDRSQGHRSLDTIFIDHMFIRSQ